MSERIELESEVIEELEQGRLISAIKVLRTKKSMGLKEAKGLIDAYLEQNPHIKVKESKGISISILFMLLAAGFLAYSLYRILFLSQ